jgi:putative membrane protein
MGAAAMLLFADGWNWLVRRRIIQLGTEEEADAAGNVVDILTRRVLHTRLRRDRRQRAAIAFHFAFGTLAGAMYGAVAESVPVVTAGMGAPFGTLEWLLGNKLTAPRFGLLKPRNSYSRHERLQTLVSHVVFGVVTEMTRSRLCKRFRR